MEHCGALRRACVRSGALVTWMLLLGADCGDRCEPADLPVSMSETRAREIDPSIETGLAISTTLVIGDCRATASREADPSCGAGNPACSSARAPLRVLVLPVNVSVPMADACVSGFAVEDVARLAVFDGAASKDGELVAALEPGRYTLYVARDRCAFCGLESALAGCAFDVVLGRWVVRDVVLDLSTR